MSGFPVAEEVRDEPRIPKTTQRPRRGWADGRLAWLIGWLWRLAIGGLFCFNYFASVAVVGWLYRWMQTRVLYGWWKQSRFRDQGTFRDFCDSLIVGGPSPRPRWLLRERIAATLEQPATAGRRFWRWLSIPIHSLWLNFKLGVQGIFCTYLATGLGCLIIFMSWEFGWLNSFNKGYEQAFFGPVTGFIGILLFIAAMFYVPMAQVHQAATGEARSFFHFRFIWALVRAKPTAYFGLAALTAVLSIIFEAMRIQVISDDFPANAAATDEEGFLFLERYFLGCSLGLFVAMLILRGLAARIYRSAVLKVLRDGDIGREELHPLLAAWLERLEMMPMPRATSVGLGQVVRLTTRWSYRRFAYAMIFLTWFVFIARFYAGYFVVYNFAVGFLNHPLVQIPCFNYMP